MKRINKHKKFLAKYCFAKHVLVREAVCPVGGRSMRIIRAEKIFDKLPLSWQLKISKAIEAAVSAYFTSNIKTTDGQMLSPYDLDMMIIYN